MKSLCRAFFVWLILGGCSWSLATGGRGDLTGLVAVVVLFVLLSAAIWLTAIAASGNDHPSYGRTFVSTIILVAWGVTLVIVQGRVEAHPDEKQTLLMAVGLAALLAVGIVVKTRAYPRWSTLRGMAITIAVPVITGGIFLWCYEVKTSSIVARAEVRWTEIGMPLSEFEKTLVASRENKGSEILRQVLRSEIGSHYYKDGTRLAAQEPAIENPKNSAALVDQAIKLLKDYPPLDDIDLSQENVDLLKTNGPALESNYRRILAAEPPGWNTDPHDGYELSVPNFLGVRKFAQLTAADALQRFSVNDQAGAALALSAGLRVADGVRRNPTLVSLMIGVAVDALLSGNQVRLPISSEDGFQAIAQDTETYRTGLLKSMQIESWAHLRFTQRTADATAVDPQLKLAFLPKWIRRIVIQPLVRRLMATAALDDVEHAAIAKSPETMSRPDLGASLHDAVSQANPSQFECNIIRATMRIHATLLLREQTELIREARARLATGRPLEGRDSVVLPHTRWELATDVEKSSVTTRLANAPEWIVKGEVAPKEFWLIPLDGSVAWKFHQPTQAAKQ